MTDADKLARVQAMLGTDAPASSVINVYLDDAASAILCRLYPFGIPSTVTTIPAQYDRLQCDLTVRYISRRGGEGQTEHSENGISRSYKTTDDDDLLCVVTPIARVFG